MSFRFRTLLRGNFQLLNMKVIHVLSICFVLYCVLVTTYYEGEDASAEGIQCPDNNLSVIPCNYDCWSNHAANDGWCTTDGNYNCICNGSGTNYSNTECTYFNAATELPYVCQCATPLLQLDYELICQNDCQCNHGGYNGTCQFDVYKCICDYDFPNGGSWNTSVCQLQAGFDVLQALQNLLNETVGLTLFK